MGLFRYIGEHYAYYNAPEGTDPMGKIIGFGRYGFFSGAYLALYDACMWSHCANAPQFLNTFGYWVVPMTGMCVTFSAVTYTMCRFRNKDDKLNYIGGALAAGSVSHVWLKCIRTSSWITSLMLLYAVLKKQAIEDGHSRSIILTEPDEEKHRKWFFSWRNLEYRNYSSKPRYPHDKEDYYLNHY